MNTKRATKRALLTSVMALVMCVVMLVGTTFAWFTDTASTGVNKIQAGKLDIQLLMRDADGDYQNIGDNQEVIFGGANSLVAQNDNQDTLWEPGKTQVAYLAIRNAGNLALKYNIILNVVDGGLIGALDYAIVPQGTKFGATQSFDGTIESWAAVKASAAKLEAGTFIAASNGCLDEIAKGDEYADETEYFALVVHMDENAGNTYMDKNVTIDVKVLATQAAAESDSFNNTYDTSALYPVYEVANVETTTTNDDEQTVVSTATTIETAQTTTVNGTSVPVATAEIPEGVVLENGATQVKLVVEDSTDAHNIEITSNQEKKTLEIKLEGVSADNAVPATVSYYIESGLTNVVLYHNETTMTKASSADAVSEDNEYYYEIGTGKVTMKSVKFSPFTYVYDAPKTATVTNRAELEAALNDATVTTIKLGADIACPTDDTSAIEVLRDVTIDFNGHVLGIGLESGTTTDGGPSANLLLTNSTNADRSGVISAIKIFEDGGFQQFAAVNAWQSKVTINGGFYEHDCVVVGSQLQAKGQQDGLVINGGTFVGQGNASTIDNEFGTININGGRFTATHKETGNGECLYVGSGNSKINSITNITAGDFFSDSARVIYVKVDTNYVQKVNISGGKFTVGENGELVVFSENVTNAKDYITITGGTFNVDPSAYVADGYEAVNNGEGIWTVKAEVI